MDTMSQVEDVWEPFRVGDFIKISRGNVLSFMFLINTY